MADYFERSLALHRELRGKWEMSAKVRLDSRDDLSLAYTPGVGAVSSAISKEPSRAHELSMKGNSVAIVSDGSAVLGLGDIGAEGALPVMEGKAVLFKEFANIDGVPLVVNTQDAASLIAFVKACAPTFGGINLEDIKAPRCFEVEDALQDIGIPVFHDDQHGTAIVLYAALVNAAKVVNKPMGELTAVINGAGAAGIAIAKLLMGIDQAEGSVEPLKNVILCDSKGIVGPKRNKLNEHKQASLSYSNRNKIEGGLKDAIKGADVFIGVSKANLLNAADIRTMAADPIILAMANPIPEIMPDEARAGGAAVVGTGRSDFPNQVNNVLAFPGIFRGALDVRAKRVTPGMKLAAALALAECVEKPTAGKILPDALDRSVAPVIAKAVADKARAEGVAPSED